MALSVVSYPALSEEDYERIQAVREEHDPLYYGVIDPHITLVFPTDGVRRTTLIEHVREEASSTAPFEVVFRCAILGDPDFEGHAHAFLVPDEGFSDLVRLHDRLYTGPLADFLRLDLPFLPHVGIANTPDPEDCKTIVDNLNAKNFEIRGRVESFDVVEYDEEIVRPIEQFSLSVDLGIET
ncbi:2'-5' RNA ligase family protein [Salinibacter grassmerensis]|uniref:2'-5' RNA ligase family protein n=1 Tax=Salinibacter grassmerensis TaxID=3040353 RepID=UPI0021E7163C|nr:2'-5' RNA ligase family protein [Salinibacter grassmerensis]